MSKFAYIDPGTGSMLISASIAMVSVAFFMLKGFIYRRFKIGGDKGEHVDLSFQFGLVFYSEGKQYWNVFSPLLKECSARGIEATYMTSDKNDPGLLQELPHIKSIFIGSNKESFYILNRLKADMVVMTTPGIDVLEIKRSKNVKHYSHIVHAPGCIAGYKAFSLDYYDSVLLAGDGDIPVIRELERKRNQEPKRIEVIGQTYLDVLRDKVKSLKIDEPYFHNNRKTVLISPTWSNHGLLTKYGASILESLEKTQEFNVIIRPHPQSFISEQAMLKNLMEQFPENDYRVWDQSVENLSAMSQADIMLSDFSGIIFDYFLLFKRPIISLNEHYEKRGRDVSDLDDDPWDVKMLSVIGQSITGSDIPKLADIIHNHLDEDFTSVVLDEKTLHTLDKYPYEAAKRGVDFIESVMEKMPAKVKVESAPHATSNGILQFFLSLSLMTSYIYIAAKIFPKKGLNQAFLNMVLPYSVALLLVIMVVLVVVSWKHPLQFTKTKENLSLKDMLFITLPMTPIVQYVLSNQDIMKFKDSFIVLALFTLISLVFVWIIPWVLSPIISKNLNLALSASFFYIIFNMASFGRNMNMYLLVVMLGVLSLVIFLMLYVDKKSIMLSLIVILFLSNSGFAFVKGFGSINAYGALNPKNGLRFDHLTKGLEIQRKPDIYLLTYDSYSNEETMIAYGWDNSDQMEYLLNQDFAIYDGTYSTGLYSLSSIGKIFSPEPEFYNLKSLRTIVAGNSAGFKELEKQGYHMSIISQNDYMLKGTQSQYDFTFPEAKSAIAPYKIIIKAVVEGEFSSEAEFSKITYEDYLIANDKLIQKEHEGPRFIYKHGSRPGHTPNVGSVESDALDQYLSRLQDANLEMRKDIESIRSHDKDAIIAVLGDHGPYLTKDGKDLSKYDIGDITRHDVQDRLGTFLAISWPEKAYYNRYDIETVQDLFPSFLAYMYQEDSLFEQARMPRKSSSKTSMGGVVVKDGVIQGGKDDGKDLFEVKGIRVK